MRSLTSILSASLLLLAGCGGNVQGSSTQGGSGGSGGSTQSTGGQGGSTSTTTTGGEGGGIGGFGGGPGLTPVRAIPGLASITFYERTGGSEPTAYEFTVNGPELTTRLDDPLGESGFDIAGASTEYYDVYYSDEQGGFELDGSYLTISGVFEIALPAGGGLNLAEIALNYVDSMPEYGNYVASYVALGDNTDESSVGKCIDGDLQTHTTMGNTVGASERLRLTLGFSSSSGEPK